MPRKKTDTAEPVGANPPEQPESSHEIPLAQPVTENGQVDKKPPVFKVGPIPTGKGESVSVAVWANEYQDRQENRTYTVYSVTTECRYRSIEGEWKSGKNYKGSQIPVLIYALGKAYDWILAQRDQSNAAPF